jgi:hypothetical protein
MISYKNYEKQVYDWLMSKHNEDENFTFSLVQKTSLNQYKNEQQILILI